MATKLRPLLTTRTLYSRVGNQATFPETGQPDADTAYGLISFDKIARILVHTHPRGACGAIYSQDSMGGCIRRSVWVVAMAHTYRQGEGSVATAAVVAAAASCRGCPFA